APAAEQPKPKPAYPPAADLPTQPGARGIRFDFNMGARLSLPGRTEGRWRARLRDLDTGNILFESENQGAVISSTKRYFLRCAMEVWDVPAVGEATQVFTHEYDARGKEVLVQFPIGTVGDTMGWFPYAARFAEQHGARVTCVMSDKIIPLLREAYPDIRF